MSESIAWSELHPSTTAKGTSVHVSRRGSVDITFQNAAVTVQEDGEVGTAFETPPSPPPSPPTSPPTFSEYALPMLRPSLAASQAFASPPSQHQRGPHPKNRGTTAISQKGSHFNQTKAPPRSSTSSFSSSSSSSFASPATTFKKTVAKKSTALNQRWVIQRMVGTLSAQNVLVAAQVNRKWNRVVDSHLQVWHRLATVYASRDAERMEADPDIANQRKQLIQVLSESCDFLRSVSAPRSTVLAHMRGSSKQLAPSVKLIARLVQLLLTPWRPLPTLYEHQNHFFENITALLNDVPTTHALLVAAHRSFASRKRMILPLPRASLQEVLELSKRRHLLAPARVAAPYRQLCEWVRAMLSCVRAAHQWQEFVVKHLKRPVLSALRRHAGYSNTLLPSELVEFGIAPSSLLSSSSFASSFPASSTSLPRAPPPPPPEPTPSQEVLPGYANTNYQYYSGTNNSSRGSHSVSKSPSAATATFDRDRNPGDNPGVSEQTIFNDVHVSDSVERAVLQLLSVIESGRTLYGQKTATPAGLFDAIDRDGHGFVTRGQIKAAFHRLSVEFTDEHFHEVTQLLTEEDRSAGKSNVVISKNSFTNGIVRLSWTLRPLSVMSRKSSWRLAESLTGSSQGKTNKKRNTAKKPSNMSLQIWKAYQPLVRELREAAQRHRHLFGQVIHKMSDYFVAIDINGDGCITKDEFRAALKRLDMGSFMTVEEINDVFNAIDVDKNGTIDRAEFQNAMKAAMTMNEKQLHKEHVLSNTSHHRHEEPHQQRHHSSNNESSSVPLPLSANALSSSSLSSSHKRKARNKTKRPVRHNEPKEQGGHGGDSSVFISATRRRSLFDHESVYTVHNSKGSPSKPVHKSPPRPAMTLLQHSQDVQSHTGRRTNHRHKKSPPPGAQHHHHYQNSTVTTRSHHESPEHNTHQRQHGKNAKGPKVQGTKTQQRIFTRLQQLRVEHEERLAAVEERYSGKMVQLSNSAETSNEHHHADLESAMDEMDAMRQRLIDMNRKNQAAVHAHADEQIAALEREKIEMATQYMSEIARLEDEKITLADAAGEVGVTRRQLLEERRAYQVLEEEHAEEIRHVLHERKHAETVRRGIVCSVVLFCFVLLSFGVD